VVCKRQGVFVEESKKEVENGWFGGMCEGCTIGRWQGEGKGGEEWGEAVASIKGKESLTSTYGDLTRLTFLRR